jgi:hypothetical protein
MAEFRQFHPVVKESLDSRQDLGLLSDSNLMIIILAHCLKSSLQLHRRAGGG